MSYCTKSVHIARFREVLFALISFIIFSTFSLSASAIDVLVTGGDLNVTNRATEEIFTNGDLVGSVDRPDWLVIRDWTTQQIAENYDVFIIPYNTADWQYDFDWTTRVLPLLAAGKGIIWEGVMTTGTGGSPLIIQQLGPRYVCPGGSICYIPNSNINPGFQETIIPVPGLTDGLVGDFTQSLGYFTQWNPALAPFLQIDALGLGTITYGLYGDYSSGRIMITQHIPDADGLSTGSLEQQNVYNLLKNAIEWTSSRGVAPDPNLRWIPNVLGLTEADAATRLATLDLVNTSFTTITNWLAPGTVRSQTPQAGAGGFVGDTVSLNVVATPSGATVTVPDITGLTYTETDLVLEAVGLGRECCLVGVSETVPQGQMITQFPRPGATSTVGWDVTPVMSSGSNPGYSPQVILMNQAEAEAAFTASGFILGSIVYRNHPVIDAGIIIDQNPLQSTLLAAGAAINMVISSGPAGTLVSVPNVVGLSQANAEAAIVAGGLVVSTVSTIGSDTVAAGDVISQSPLGGATVGAGSGVDIVVSAEPNLINVPDVVGLTQADAETSIVAAGLPVGAVTTAFSDTIPAASIVSTSPAAGTAVLGGTPVNLVVSDGPEPALAIVPDVRQATQAAAEAAIIANLLTVGNITFEYSPAFPVVDAGNVISSNPSGGALVLQGTPVDLVISIGPTQPTLIDVPNVVRGTYANAIKAIESIGLTVGNVTTVTKRRSCGIVRSQSPTGGATVAPGTAIDLVITRTRFCNPL